MNAIDDVAKLLGAASQSPDRSVRLVYLAEARVLLAREADRIAELRLLLEGSRPRSCTRRRQRSSRLEPWNRERG